MLEEAARAWAADDPDPETRAQIEAWLAAADQEALHQAFHQRLQFGTAGIRGPIGPGPNGMNRRLARQVAAGLAAHLGSGATVVVGRDGRRLSPELAEDVAAVLAGAGVRTLLLPGPVPTPLVAFAVRHLGCTAGVMVTASHNPPSDNGVKVYAGDGAQIVSPTDQQISEAIDAITTVLDVPLGEPGRLGNEVLDAYLDAAASRVPVGPRDVTVVHTAMHGVGTAPLRALFERAGFAAPHAVAAQAEPDPTFPTVSFPNPEEPGALDLALADARRLGADVLLATDPDADRLAAAVPDGNEWRVLTCDELGALLAEQALATTSGDDRLVVSSIVSSTLLGKLAVAHGAQWVTTLTGFKWIARAVDGHPGTRFVFGYEEALGYAVHDLLRDKDGLTAAAAFASLVAEAKAAGETVVDRLDALARRYGLHATRQWSIRVPGSEGTARIAAAVQRLVDAPPEKLADRLVASVDRPAHDVIVLELDAGTRVIVRPSGTEPKLKAYFQVVVDPVTNVDAARAEAATTIDALQASLAALVADATMEG